jgi:hypothetical protein
MTTYDPLPETQAMQLAWKCMRKQQWVRVHQTMVGRIADVLYTVEAVDEQYVEIK